MKTSISDRENIKFSMLKMILCSIPEFRRFSHRYMGLLYWLAGLMDYYEGNYIAGIERRPLDENGIEDDIHYSFYARRFFL